VSDTFVRLQARLSDERFANWLFVLGTVVAVRLSQTQDGVHSNTANASYYNFAPIQVGGETRIHVIFKHHISMIDFPKTAHHSWQALPSFPRPRNINCSLNRNQKECLYSTLPNRFLEDAFGFQAAHTLPDGVLEVKGLRVGIEICLDHLVGTLAEHLGPRRTVDVHLIVSAGMAVARGPVCTRQGGPIFLADGFGRTAMSLNLFGSGREATRLPDGTEYYNVGVVYGADSVVGLGQWIGTTIEAFTGRSFGSRLAGFGILPGDKDGNGTGIKFDQISALGNNWLQQLEGLFDTANYREAEHFYSLIAANANERQRTENLSLHGKLGDLVAFFPTVDFYGPVPVV